VGGHTIANLLRGLDALAPGHPSSAHRVFSRNRWSSWTLAHRFAQTVLARFVPHGPIEVAGDDTVDEHPGKTVYGKGCHRDPVRFTQSFTAYRWEHKWVVLALLVRAPWTTRRWALPLLVALYQPEDENREQGRVRPVECIWKAARKPAIIPVMGRSPVRESTPCLGATSSTSAGTPSSTISAAAARPRPISDAQCRCIGEAKAQLQHLLAAAAIDVVRLSDWWAGMPLALARTRCSRFASLQPAA
jgi:hypothetical protein